VDVKVARKHQLDRETGERLTGQRVNAVAFPQNGIEDGSARFEIPGFARVHLGRNNQCAN
jgi:hypothetical protein